MPIHDDLSVFDALHESQALAEWDQEVAEERRKKLPEMFGFLNKKQQEIYLEDLKTPKNPGWRLYAQRNWRTLEKAAKVKSINAFKTMKFQVSEFQTTQEA